MSKIQALILAAGRGSRLGHAAEEAPKSLLQIGRRHLIEHQIEALADSGVGPVHVVVGYGADEVRELVGMRADFIYNKRWATTNSLYSFWLAREAVSGDVIVLNCDVLFSADVIERLLDSPGDAIAIDSSSGTGREQMAVRIVDGRVVEMGKDLPAAEVSGENVGILKLTAASAKMLFDKAGELVDGADGENHWLGAAVAALARHQDFRAVDVAGIPWVEIDFPVDLARARKEVWPAIQGGAHRRRRFRVAALWALGASLIAAALLVGKLWSAPEAAPPLPLPAPPSADWETVSIESLPTTQVSVGERLQDWWVLSPGRFAEAHVSGPGPLRIETRFLDHDGQETPYVLEATLDGKLLDYYRVTTRPSGSATHPDWTVGRKKRVSTELEDGVHLLRVRLLAPADATCLVRFRQIEDGSDE